MTLRLVLRGLLSGLALAGALTMWDGIAGRGHLFGLQTMLIGVTAGAGALVLAFLMAVLCYRLAMQGRAIVLRRRLLAGAIWTGAAGMAMGFACAAVWLAAGHPWAPLR